MNAKYITIRIPNDRKNFHTAIRISAAKSGMKLGEYLCYVLRLDENFVEVLKTLK